MIRKSVGGLFLNTVRKMASFQCANRVRGTTPSIWVEFTALAVECGAINIGQGFPDYPPPKYILDTMAQVASGSETAHFNQYTRGYGHLNLVKRLATLYSTFGLPIDPLSDVLITNGAYQALFYAAMAFLNPGDEAIIIEPAFDCYDPQVRMANATPVFIPLRLEPPTDGRMSSSADLKLDFDELESKFSSKTKMIFLNNPHNPTGKLFTREELLKIAELAQKYDVIVISDEVYEWMVYEPNKMIRFAALPNMWERTITIGSAGKTFNVTGWKMGWAIAPKNLLWPLRCVHQNCVYTCPTVIQESVARCFDVEMARLDTDDCYFKQISRELLPKRDKMAAFLSEAGMKPIVPEAGYFMMADYTNLKIPWDKIKTEETKDYQFVRWLCKEKKLAGIPPSAFYCKEHKNMGEDYIRFCFFKKDSTLEGADKILKDWVAAS